MGAFRYLLITGWAVWLGSVVFFSFVVAPTAFSALGRDGAVPFLRAIFPRYYLVGIASGASALAAALMARPDLRVTAPLAIGLVLSTYARQVLTPAVNAAREAADDARFAVVHRLSVQLNVVVLALLLLVGTVLASAG